MADESDVDTALVDIIDAAIYPLGTTHPSTVGVPCKIFPGWPVSATLEADLAAGLTNISVYAVPSSASVPEQPFLTEDAVIVPAVHGLSATVSGSTITLAGAPGPREYATAVVDGVGYSYVAQTGDDAAAVATGLASELAAAFPGTAAVGTSIQVATNQAMLLRLGAPGIVGTRIHRQRQQYRITVWAPSPEDRIRVAKLVDVALKRNVTIRLPDTTMAIVTYQGTNLADTYELNGLYRRDLIFSVTYDTLDTYEAFEVTSVGIETDASVRGFDRLPILTP